MIQAHRTAGEKTNLMGNKVLAMNGEIANT